MRRVDFMAMVGLENRKSGNNIISAMLTTVHVMFNGKLGVLHDYYKNYPVRRSTDDGLGAGSNRLLTLIPLSSIPRRAKYLKGQNN